LLIILVVLIKRASSGYQERIGETI